MKVMFDSVLPFVKDVAIPLFYDSDTNFKYM